MWKDDTKPDEKSFDFQREFFEVVVDHRILIEANESRINQLGGRGIAVVQRWDMGLDDWEIVYRRDTDHEAGNTAIPRSIREKTKFLHEILETTFDTAAMEEHFGRPYSTGDTISSDCADDPNVNFTHRKYWVRDLEHTVLLPLLSIS